MQVPEGAKFVTPDGFEICVLCLEKADPPVLFNTDITERAGYIEGCGQTCTNKRLCRKRQTKRLSGNRQ